MTFGHIAFAKQRIGTALAACLAALAPAVSAAGAQERSVVPDAPLVAHADVSSGAYRDRFEVIRPRRVRAALAVLATIALAWALAGARVAALTLLWAPTTALVAAALGTPSLTAELAVVGPGSAALAWLTDRLLAWPRGLVLGVIVLGAVTVYLRTGATRTEAVLPDP